MSASKNGNFFKQNKAWLTLKRKVVVSCKIWTICHGGPRNFANWPGRPAEFGKIYHVRLWVLVIGLSVNPYLCPSHTAFN